VGAEQKALNKQAYKVKNLKWKKVLINFKKSE
jgi:hypothetical protein